MILRLYSADADQLIVNEFVQQNGSSTSGASTEALKRARSPGLSRWWVAIFSQIRRLSASALYHSTMPAQCPECVRLWDTYYASSVEAFRAQEELAAAKLEDAATPFSKRLTLIAGLAIIAERLACDLRLASAKIASHRAAHPPDGV